MIIIMQPYISTIKRNISPEIQERNVLWGPVPHSIIGFTEASDSLCCFKSDQWVFWGQQQDQQMLFEIQSVLWI